MNKQKNQRGLLQNGLLQNGKFKKTIAAYLIMAPGLIYIIINNILPLYGLTIAFRDISYKVRWLFLLHLIQRNLCELLR